MNKIEKRISLLWQTRDIQNPYWLCVYDYKLGNLHFEVLKDPVSGRYSINHAMNPTLVVTSFDLRELLENFFKELSLSTHNRLIPFRGHFTRYYGFIQNLKREPTLF